MLIKSSYDIKDILIIQHLRVHVLMCVVLCGVSDGALMCGLKRKLFTSSSSTFRLIKSEAAGEALDLGGFALHLLWVLMCM